jgi:hypothetical protein
MPQPAGGFISGDPEAMASFTAQGPAPASLGSPPVLTTTGLTESKQFALADEAATRQLIRFITEANQGFQNYTTVAALSGAAYLDANEAGEAAITSVSTGLVR